MKTPTERLDLREGELVQVKPFGEILKTLDCNYRNRGLYFDPEMVPFTERTYEVQARLQQIIDERTGRMVRFKSDAIVLKVVPTLVYAGRPFGIGTRDVLRTVGPPMAAGLITVVIGFMAQELFLGDYSRLARLTFSSFICLATYFTVAVGVFRMTGPIQLGLSLLHDLTPTRLRSRP
jgi:hypothetical protein